jgi:hypothetical protein
MLLQVSPILRIAHELKEDMMKIYNSSITPAKAIKQMKKWFTSANIILGNAAETLNIRKCSRGTDGVLAIDKRYQWCFTSKNFHRSHL